MKPTEKVILPPSLVEQAGNVQSVERAVELAGLLCWMKSLRQSHDGHFKTPRTLCPHARRGNPVNRVHFLRYPEMAIYERRRAAATVMNLMFQLSNKGGLHGLTGWFEQHINGPGLQAFARRQFSRAQVQEAEKALIQRVVEIAPDISGTIEAILGVHDLGPDGQTWEWNAMKERDALFEVKLQELKAFLPSLSLSGWSPELWVEKEIAPIVIKGKTVHQMIRKGAAFGGSRFECINMLDAPYGLSNKRPAVFAEAIHMESALHMLPSSEARSWYELARRDFMASFGCKPDRMMVFEVVKNKRRKLIASLSVISALCKEEWQALQAPFSESRYRLHRLPEVKYLFLSARIMQLLNLKDDHDLRRVWLLNEMPLEENTPNIFSHTEEILTAALLSPDPESFLLNYVMSYLEVLSQDIIQYGPDNVAEKSRRYMFQGLRSEEWMEKQATFMRIKLRQAFSILEEGIQFDFNRPNLMKQTFV